MTRPVAVLVATTVLLAILEGVLPVAAHVPPGTYGVVGAIGCVVLVVVAKLLGKLWLQRPERTDE